MNQHLIDEQLKISAASCAAEIAADPRKDDPNWFPFETACCGVVWIRTSREDE